MARSSCVLLALLTVVHGAEDANKGKVIALDATTFDKFVEDTPLLMVEFYAPWCGHCKQLEPEYSAAATILKEDNVKLAKVDAADEKNQRLAATHDVQGFPTLKFFKNKKAEDYMGERTATAIVAFMRKKAGPASTYLENDGGANEFKEMHDVVVIGFFDNKHVEQFKAFETAADQVNGVHFGHVFDNGIRTLMRAEKNSVILFKKFDEKRIVYEGEFMPKPLEDFAFSNSMPLVIPFNEANAPKIFGGKTKVHLIVFADEEKHHDVIAKLAGPAAKFKGEALFITVGPSEAQITEYFGVSKDDMPAVRLIDMREAGMKKYVYSKPVVDEASLESFVEDFKENRLQATLKSEDPPAEDEGPVKSIVAKTWQRIVWEDEKDVLVEFYAPWCGHCKELAPKYEALAVKLAPLADKLVLAKLNSEANEIEDVVVEGFPTLRLYPAGKKHDPEEFTGERSGEAIEAWLAKTVTHKWETDPAKAEEAKAAIVKEKAEKAKAHSWKTPQEELDKIAAKEKAEEAAKEAAEAAKNAKKEL